MVYLFLSTGVALVKTHCICSDITDIAVYDISDAENNLLSGQNCCDEKMPEKENLPNRDLSACGCDNPTITYLKLNNHPGSETKIEYPAGKTLTIAHFPDIVVVALEKEDSKAEEYPHYSPPQKLYGRTLITFINQRKIALTA